MMMVTERGIAEVAEGFRAVSEELHSRFLAMWTDGSCANCHSAALANGILAAWIQTGWGEFVRKLIVFSALGFPREDGTYVNPVPGVSGFAEAEQAVKDIAKQISERHRMCSPVWHATWFGIEVSSKLELRNLASLEETIGATAVPGQINILRNVLVHPGEKNVRRYEELQAKLGMLDVAPEMLAWQMRSPGLPIFTSWVRELQSVADGSVQ